MPDKARGVDAPDADGVKRCTEPGFCIGFDPITGGRFQKPADTRRKDLVWSFEHRGGPAMGRVENHPGTVTYVTSNKPPDDAFWDDLEPSAHYPPPARDWTHKSDFSRRRGQVVDEWYGPAHDFRVKTVGWYRDWGSRVVVQFASPPGVRRELAFGHLTHINVDLQRAYLGRDLHFLPAGTYLGATRFELGLSSGGAHLHVVAEDGTHRDEWIRWLRK